MHHTLFGLLAALAADAKPLQIKWEKNMLTIRGEQVPGEAIPINYLEAYCKSGSTNQDWGKTVIPHSTQLISATPTKIRLRCKVEPSVVVEHEIESSVDDVTFRLVAKNEGDQFVDVQWAQPCMRVKDFTGLGQDDYFKRCFLFTERGLAMMHETHRADKALYVPGQVYVPKGVDLKDVNPRPISKDVPINGLVGAYSADGKKILAMAWSDTQEIFQGVIVCIHNDFRIGGLKPGETKKLLGKVYVVDNDVPALVRRYESDFGVKAKTNGLKWDRRPRLPLADGVDFSAANRTPVH